jgi:hypothetical protein
MQRQKRRQGDAGLLWALLVVGTLPFIGLLIVGSWSQAELGFGTALILFAAHGLVAEYRSQR